jgi:GNAT superfamily N-acetyltransferase
MTVTYRIATVEDIAAIKQISDQMLADTKLGLATLPKIKNLVESPRTLFMLALDRQQLVGFVCGVIHECVFNDRLRVTDIGVFVLPEHRKSDIAKTLIAHLEKWAKARQADELWLGQTTGDKPQSIARFYSSLGYTVCGFNAMKEL